MERFFVVYTLCFCSFFCHAQKTKSVIGTYFSKDTLSPITLILKPGSDKSISGILITEAGREYTYFTHHNNTLTGYYLPSQPAKNIQIVVKGDSLEMFITNDGLTKQSFLSKLKVRELDLSGVKQLDQVLFGKWIYFDERRGKLIHNQYFIYNPDGKLEFSHPKQPDIMNNDIIKSGKVKPRWTTQNQRIYMLFETSLPLPIINSPGSTYRVAGDTLYTTNTSGKVYRSVRDKSFMP